MTIKVPEHQCIFMIRSQDCVRVAQASQGEKTVQDSTLCGITDTSNRASAVAINPQKWLTAVSEVLNRVVHYVN